MCADGNSENNHSKNRRIRLLEVTIMIIKSVITVTTHIKINEVNKSV